MVPALLYSSICLLIHSSVPMGLHFPFWLCSFIMSHARKGLGHLVAPVSPRAEGFIGE